MSTKIQHWEVVLQAGYLSGWRRDEFPASLCFLFFPDHTHKDRIMKSLGVLQPPAFHVDSWGALPIPCAPHW